jgi:hypothetical protein
MKHLIRRSIAVAAMAAAAACAQAPQTETHEGHMGMQGKGMTMEHGGAMHRDSTAKPMHGMMEHGMMMQFFSPREIVALPDGGVIVVAGSSLMKYDKDLNLVKATMVKLDSTQVNETMKQMMKYCPAGCMAEKMEHENLKQPEEKPAKKSEKK